MKVHDRLARRLARKSPNCTKAENSNRNKTNNSTFAYIIIGYIFRSIATHHIHTFLSVKKCRGYVQRILGL